ncbi:MAG: hypothetical protein M1834_000505 [Cirrosporium novae-zelandiae]|nr:MAG: hypothetical protein M1834_000505 [Cirrosporium novae-zelandiae]
MATATTTTRALVTTQKPNGDGISNMEVKDITLPPLKSNELLVRVEYAAQNPTDVISQDSGRYGPGAVLGCDFCGLIQEVGNSVTRFKIGERVGGLIWGGRTKGIGAYSSHTIAEEEFCFRVPGDVTKGEEAATIPLAANTAWMALFSNGTSVGQYAIQIAAMFGFTIVTTCSTHNFDMCKRLGSTHVFDYHDPDVVEKIKKAVPDITYVFDAVGSKESSRKGSEAVSSSKGGVLCTVRPGKTNTEAVVEGVRVTDVVVWTGLNREIKLTGYEWPASKEDYELSVEFYENLPKYLISGAIKPNTPKILNGLEAVSEGFKLHRERKISAFKIVYKV